MALVVNDRVKETSTTTGTGTFTLAGAVTGFETFSSAIGNTNTTYYAIVHTSNSEFEVGLGTVAAGTLARTTVISSSNSDSAVDFAAGTKDVFCTLPASKSVILDASGNIVANNGSNLTALNASNLSSGTVANARLDQQLQDVAGLAVTDGNFIVGDGSNFVAENGATARTSLGLGTAAVLDTGISNTNVAKFTTGVADDDFLRVNGTDIEGRSASEVRSDLSLVASATTDTTDASNISSGTLANARLDAQLQDVAGLAVTDGNFIVGDGSNFVAESGSTARTSLGLGTSAVLDTGISNTNVPKFTTGVADDDFLRVNGTDIEGRSASEVLSDIGGQASLTFGIANTNAVKIDSASVADDDFARFTLNGLEGRSASEVRSDLSLVASATTDTTNASNISSGTLANARLDAQLQDVAGLAVTNGNFIVGDGSNFVAESGSTARDSLSLGTSNDVQFDSFGVGTAASGTTGEIRATNDVTAFYSSDASLKENVKNIENPLEKVNQINGVTFDWTEDYIKEHGGEDDYFVRKNDVGVIAQEVEKVLPEVVATRKDGIKAVKYDRIVALLIESIKELKKEIEELKTGA
jgi:hypothetical protein